MPGHQGLGCRVHYIMNHPECPKKDIISTYYSPRTRSTRPLQAGDINKMIKTVISLRGLDKKGLPPAVVSRHSLRAGGAMTMHLNKNIDQNKIKKQACSSSNTTFLIGCTHRLHFMGLLGVNMTLIFRIPFIMLLTANQDKRYYFPARSNLKQFRNRMTDVRLHSVCRTVLVRPTS
jgi:hypothetical protein